jgi:hypothetical protein
MSNYHYPLCAYRTLVAQPSFPPLRQQQVQGERHHPRLGQRKGFESR